MFIPYWEIKKAIIPCKFDFDLKKQKQKQKQKQKKEEEEKQKQKEKKKRKSARLCLLQKVVEDNQTIIYWVEGEGANDVYS